MLTSELVRHGYELIDNQDSFVVRRSLSAEANLLLSIGPYESASPSGVRVDVVLGIQYPDLQRLWNRLIEHQPEDPTAAWSVMSAGAERWNPDSARASWFYCKQENVDSGSTTSSILEAVQRRGLPYCDRFKFVTALLTACAQDIEQLWGCDLSYLLPVALCMTGRSDEAKEQAGIYLYRLEAESGNLNPMYLETYRRFAANIALLARNKR